MKKLLFLTVVLMMIMSSCAAPMEAPVPTAEVISVPTETPLPTVTPTPEPTPTYAVVPTSTSTPEAVYTELGKQAAFWADFFDWEIVLCGPEIIQEDLDRGIILMREDSAEYFCDFTGYLEEPLPEPTSTGYISYLFMFVKIKGKPGLGRDGFTFISTANDKYVKSPSTMIADDWIRLYFYNSLEEYLRTNSNKYLLPIRTWPITEEEYDRCEVIWRARVSGSSE